MREVGVKTPKTAVERAQPGERANATDKFLEMAMRFKGQPYLWGGGHGGTFSKPGPVDCSGLITQAAAMAGIPGLAGTAAVQQDKGKSISPVTPANLKPGDLVFMGNPAHHVGIYIGNNQVLHAPHTGDVVKISPLTGYGWDGAARVFDEAGKPIAGQSVSPGSYGGSSSGGGGTGGGGFGGGGSSIGGGGSPSSMSLPSGGGMPYNPALEALKKSTQEDEKRNKQHAAQANPGAPKVSVSASPVNSGLKNVDSKSVGDLGGLMAKLEGIGVDKAFLESLSEKYGVPLKMILAVIQQESGGDPNARSGVGAQGLMQLMPDTARGLGVTDPNDPKQNIEGGVKYLAQQLKAFDGDPQKALAAYNAGPGNVQKYGGVPPFAETQAYVKNITTMMA